MASGNLVKTPQSTGNRRVWTYSAWHKRQNIEDKETILFSKVDNDNQESFGWAHDTATPPSGFYFRDETNESAVNGYTVGSYRDQSAWYHVLLALDTTNEDQNERLRIFINGVLRGPENAWSFLSRNERMAVNTFGAEIQLFGGGDSGSDDLENLVCDMFFVDGQCLGPDVFGFHRQGYGTVGYGGTINIGYTDGEWVPKKPATIKRDIERRKDGNGFGVNGFYLPLNTPDGIGSWGADFHCPLNTILNVQEHLPQPKSGFAATANSGIGYTDILRTDPYASNLVLALPMVKNGIQTGFGDYSHIIRNSGVAKTVVQGAASIGQTGAYYGSAGMGFTEGIGKSSYVVNNVDLNFGSEDFCIEGWCFPKGAPGVEVTSPSNHDTLKTTKLFGLYNMAGSINRRSYIVYKENSGGQGIRGIVSGDGLYDADTGNTDPNINMAWEEWNHFAFTKEGNTTRVFQNGILTGINTQAPTTLYNNTIDNIEFGSGIGASGENFEYGYLSDFRVYKGVAKYTESFDCPRPANMRVNASTSSGIGTYRVFPDVPRNNFATLNPASDTDAINSVKLSYSCSNLIADWSAVAQNGATFGSVGISSGKWYWEVLVNAVGGDHPFVGISSAAGISTCQSTANNGIAVAKCGTYCGGGANGAGGGFSDGDIIGIALSFTDAGLASTCTFYKNGTEIAGGGIEYFNNGGGADETGIVFVPSLSGVNECQMIMNFGQNPTFSNKLIPAQSKIPGTYKDDSEFGTFKYEPPSGHLALCTRNLYEPTINQPTKYFSQNNWYGDGTSARATTGIGFTSDLVWTKTLGEWNVNNSWCCMDSVRGEKLILHQNSTSAEATDDNEILAFGSDGFTVGSADQVNKTDVYYGGWGWKAGGAPSVEKPFMIDGVGYATTTAAGLAGGTNDPTSASINRTSGLSILNYKGTGGSNFTIAHGLNKTPKFVLIKSRRTNNSWAVYHHGIGPEYGTRLNYDNPAVKSADYWNNTWPTSSLLTVGTSAWLNGGTSVEYIAYIWAEVEGFSKFGHYVGNTSPNGPFLYCGFKPSFVMFRNVHSTADADNWRMYTDNIGGPQNPNAAFVEPDEASTPARVTTHPVDFYSNGIKLRGSNDETNQNPEEYIYMAFAESPFKYSNAK